MAYLDARFGPRWVDWVNPQVLDLKYDEACVLGQILGSYNKEVVPLGRNGWGRFRRLGMDLTHFRRGRKGKNDKNWRKLTAAWRDAVVARRGV